MSPTPNRHRTAVIALGIFLVCCPHLLALNPDLDLNQYAHTAWSSRQGFFKGGVTSIAQTPDGFLWLGTDYGLLRFDGVRSVPWQPPTGQHLPNISIVSLLVSRNGTLWIGTLNGLASWKDGKLTQYPEVPGQEVDALLEDREGTIWAGVEVAQAWVLCAIQRGSVQCHGEDGSIGLGVGSLFEDRGGNLWVGTQTGLWRWKPGRPEVFPLSPAMQEIQALIEGANGALLIATRGGIIQLVDGKAEAYPLPGTGRQVNPFSLLRDSDGGLWVGTRDRGLLHVHHGRTDVFSQSDGLSSDRITALFEDREGNVWAATVNGLDRFRDFAVPTVSVKQGLSTAGVESVLAARDGSIWLGTPDGLNRWHDGRMTIYRKLTDRGLPDDQIGSLFQDDRGRLWVSTPRGVVYFENGRFVPASSAAGGFVHAIAEDSVGDLWVGPDQGLFRLRRGKVIEQIPWARLGQQGVALALVGDQLQGGLWFGFGQGGVAYFKDGQVHASYAAADGLGGGRVAELTFDRDGALWAATAGGLSRLKNGRVFTLTTNNGLPCNTIHWAVEDSGQAFYLKTACGLVHIARAELDLWVSDPTRTIQATVFDNFDGVGLHSKPVSSASPRAAWSPDGKLWFLSGDGVSVFDPHHVLINTLPPPVYIEAVIADHRTYETSSSARLPPLVRDLTIEYTALSLVAPEKNRFRVKLEGRDRDWQDVGTRRQAFYTDLAPGNYRFRVVASNNSGVWNEAGASYELSIAPAYYQTTWFRASVVVAALLLPWALYQFRLRQLAHEFDARLQARVNERTRVARELHDTLLQTFHGALFRFQAAVNMLPERPAEAKQTFESAIDRAAQAITEGRDAIQDLRVSTVVTNDLAGAISTLGDELAASGANGKGTAVHVAVRGTPRDLHPILRDDIYRIAGEALRNGFRHSHARRIEVEITYDDWQFRLQVRDDGRGIDRAVLADEPRGHFGLPGMRERAELVGGRLNVWSEDGVGTEVDLTIPASKAYAMARARRRTWWFGKKTGTDS